MSQARRTWYFARSATRARSARRGKEKNKALFLSFPRLTFRARVALHAKYRVRPAWLIKRLSCRLAARLQCISSGPSCSKAGWCYPSDKSLSSRLILGKPMLLHYPVDRDFRHPPFQQLGPGLWRGLGWWNLMLRALILQINLGFLETSYLPLP